MYKAFENQLRFKRMHNSYNIPSYFERTENKKTK